MASEPQPPGQSYPAMPRYGEVSPGTSPAGRQPAGPAPSGAPPASPQPVTGARRAEASLPVETTPSGGWLAVGMAVVFNVVTLVGVLAFGWPPGNVFLLFWLENAVLGLATLAKVATAELPAKDPIIVNGRPAGSSPRLYALFFCFHYGMFCLVHLVFTVIVAVKIGVQPTFFFLGFPLILLVIRYAVETATSWFGTDGLRHHTSPQQAMMQPYPRIIVLHLAVMAAFALVVVEVGQRADLPQLTAAMHWLMDLLPVAYRSEGVAVVAVLLVIKTVVDVYTTRRAVPLSFSIT